MSQARSFSWFYWPLAYTSKDRIPCWPEFSLFVLWWFSVKQFCYKIFSFTSTKRDSFFFCAWECWIMFQVQYHLKNYLFNYFLCTLHLAEYDLENPRIMTKCEHHFHLSCILEWRERSDTCPVCDQVCYQISFELVTISLQIVFICLVLFLRAS